jgi:hypothetical protein
MAPLLEIGDADVDCSSEHLAKRQYVVPHGQSKRVLVKQARVSRSLGIRYNSHSHGYKESYSIRKE